MSALESLRRSTRTTLLFTDLVVGAVPAWLVVRSGFGPVQSVVVLSAAAVVLALHIRGVVRTMRGPVQPIPLRRTYGLAALATALTCVMSAEEAATGILGSLYTGLAMADFVVARPWRTALRHMGIMVTTHLAAAITVIVLTGQSAALGRAVIAILITVVAVGYGVAIAYRQWEAGLKLEEARHTAAELAATRERLRLAEDLHDILGHALEVVSLKSELAVRLDDPAKAKDEMAEVQRLARTALQDVRALVHGGRPTDLATELAGARTLLDSAGITCEFDADPAALNEQERELLGRVLREAMTNALRHADPKRCAVSLTRHPDRVVLTVVNDGTAPSDPSGRGSGLASLARRVTAAGGEFTARDVGPGSFEVIASLPR